MLSFLLFCALSGGQAFAGGEDPFSGDIVTAVRVREWNWENLVIEMEVRNPESQPFQLLIRDSAGSVIFREWIKSGDYETAVHLRMAGNGILHIEVMQGKRTVETMTLLVVRRLADTLEQVE